MAFPRVTVPRHFGQHPAKEVQKPWVSGALFPDFLARENRAPAGEAKQLKREQRVSA